jgi:hypothetical protein
MEVEKATDVVRFPPRAGATTKPVAVNGTLAALPAPHRHNRPRNQSELLDLESQKLLADGNGSNGSRRHHMRRATWCGYDECNWACVVAEVK